MASRPRSEWIVGVEVFEQVGRAPAITPAAPDANSNLSHRPPSFPHTSSSRLPNFFLPRCRALKRRAPQSRRRTPKLSHSNSWDKAALRSLSALGLSFGQIDILRSSTHLSE